MKTKLILISLIFLFFSNIKPSSCPKLSDMLTKSIKDSLKLCISKVNAHDSKLFYEDCKECCAQKYCVDKSKKFKGTKIKGGSCGHIIYTACKCLCKAAKLFK